MNPTTRPILSERVRSGLLAAAILAGSAALAACAGASTSTPTPTTTTSSPVPTAPSGDSQVLPVTADPITNNSTVQALKIDSVLVENNVGVSGKPADDHLEIALTNTGPAELRAFEVFYTFTDPTTNATESYYARLPASFAIPAGGHRIAHFDDTGRPDHFPVSNFSLYYTDANALDGTVIVSASGSAIQTATFHKDAGGAEAAD